MQRSDRLVFLLIGMVLVMGGGCGAAAPTTEVRYLSGTGRHDAVDWGFVIDAGRRAGERATIPVPSQWEQHGFGRYHYGREQESDQEVGTYRTTFEMEATTGKTVKIVFQGVMTDAKVRVNGRLAGPVHRGGFTAFAYDITPLIVTGENELEVEVKRRSDNAHVNRSQRKTDFWLFAGIFRPVYLEISPRDHIERVAIDAPMSGAFAMDVYTAGGADRVEARITTLGGEPVGDVMRAPVRGASGKTTLRSAVRDAALWSPESPSLYRVEVTLYRGDEAVHTMTERFGFRTFEARAGAGFYLNGRRVLLKGVNRHCFRPESGRTLSREDSYEDVRLIKSMNMNAVRCSHYAPDKHFLEACDELGLLVINELLAWHTPVHESVGVGLVRELVTRDVNHPSVVMWANGNHRGYNPKLSPVFHEHDPQKRVVLWMEPRLAERPGPVLGVEPIDTRFYPSHEMLAARLGDRYIVVPCEALHALYDGGGGAGLADFWEAIEASPVGGGLFFWALADEGIVRTDRDGAIDVQGNAAPDGLVGPRFEKEGSYYTVRKVFSPIQVDEPEIGAGFDGRVRVHNRYVETNLRDCVFERTLIRGGQRQTAALVAPRVEPGGAGTIDLRLPEDARLYEMVSLTAYGPDGESVWTWTWALREAKGYVPRQAPSRWSGTVTTEGNTLIVRTGEMTYAFDRRTARLLEAKRGGRAYALRHGPDRVDRASDPFLDDKTGERRVGGRVNTEARGDEQETGEGGTVHAGLSGRRLVENETGRAATVTEHDGGVTIELNGARGFEQLRWTIDPAGRLKLAYAYRVEGWHDFFGITFDYAESQIEGVQWMGQGPSRVWKNRLDGTDLGVWRVGHKDLEPGRDFDYPYFKGYRGPMIWTRLIEARGAVRVHSETEGLFFRLFTPRWGAGERKAVEPMPRGDVSFLHGIAPIGTKWRKPHVLGPRSYPNDAAGTYEGVLWFTFE